MELVRMHSHREQCATARPIEGRNSLLV